MQTGWKVLLAGLSLLLVGCQSMPARDVDSALGVEWQLERVGDQSGTGVQTLLLARDGDALSVAGFAGCNRFSGTGTVEGANALTVGALASTRRGCSDELVMRVENAYLQALSNTPFDMGVSQDELVLRGTDITLVFKRPAG